MNDKLKHIFEQSECPARESLFSYMAGTLTRAERFRIEAHLTDCDFCSEAVEAFRGEQGHDKIQEHLKSIEERIRRQSSGLEKLGGSPRRTWLKYAALIVFAIGSLSSLYFLLSGPGKEELVMEAPVSRQAPSVQKQERKNQPAPAPARALQKASENNAASGEVPVPTYDLPENAVESDATKDVQFAQVQNESKAPAQKKKVVMENTSATTKIDAASEEVRETSLAAVTGETSTAETLSLDEAATTTQSKSGTTATRASSSILDKAITLYEKGYYIETINLLGNFKGKDKRESGKADWYLANAYIQTREYEKARTVLERLESGGSGYSRKARKLLDNIK